MALSFHVMFYYYDALLFRVPALGLVFFCDVDFRGHEAPQTLKKYWIYPGQCLFWSQYKK